MTTADFFRALTVSGTAFLVGSMLSALRSIRTTKRTRPAPPWVNNLFTLGAVLLAVGAAWQSWDTLGGRIVTPARLIGAAGTLILSASSLLLTRYFARNGEDAARQVN